jgi:hypothetical protein
MFLHWIEFGLRRSVWNGGVLLTVAFYFFYFGVRVSKLKMLLPFYPASLLLQMKTQFEGRLKNIERGRRE